MVQLLAEKKRALSSTAMVDPMALRCSLGSGCSEEPEGGPGEQAAGEKQG